jgi:hypothetical protein
VLGALLFCATARVAHAEPIKNMVLGYGAFVDGWGWRAVYDILVRDGYAGSRASARTSPPSSQTRIRNEGTEGRPARIFNFERERRHAAKIVAPATEGSKCVFFNLGARVMFLDRVT